MRWLLLLGAEEQYRHTLASARAQLATLGVVDVLTGEHASADTDGSSRRYLNQLVCLACPGPRDALIQACKRIEREVGRGRLDGVPLDVDVLACACNDTWQRDAHAVAKGEFEALHVRALLDEAGLGRTLDA